MYCMQAKLFLEPINFTLFFAKPNVVIANGLDCGLDLDFKSFLLTGFLNGSDEKNWIGLKSKILDLILDFFQPMMGVWQPRKAM